MRHLSTYNNFGLVNEQGSTDKKFTISDKVRKDLFGAIKNFIQDPSKPTNLEGLAFHATQNRKKPDISIEFTYQGKTYDEVPEDFPNAQLRGKKLNGKCFKEFFTQQFGKKPLEITDYSHDEDNNQITMTLVPRGTSTSNVVKDYLMDEDN
jgi:hypothetical protein